MGIDKPEGYEAAVAGLCWIGEVEGGYAMLAVCVRTFEREDLIEQGTHKTFGNARSRPSRVSTLP